eukprot:scpid59187/ scgid34834/ 
MTGSPPTQCSWCVADDDVSRLIAARDCLLGAACSQRVYDCGVRIAGAGGGNVSGKNCTGLCAHCKRVLFNVSYIGPVLRASTYMYLDNCFQVSSLPVCPAYK